MWFPTHSQSHSYLSIPGALQTTNGNPNTSSTNILPLVDRDYLHDVVLKLLVKVQKLEMFGTRFMHEQTTPNHWLNQKFCGLGFLLFSFSSNLQLFEMLSIDLGTASRPLTEHVENSKVRQTCRAYDGCQSV